MCLNIRLYLTLTYAHVHLHIFASELKTIKEYYKDSCRIKTTYSLVHGKQEFMTVLLALITQCIYQTM